MAAIPPHFRHLADIVQNNLQNQQDWTQIQTHLDTLQSLRRPLLSGLPPRRLYVHPDEQIEILRAERSLGPGKRIPQPPEFEWVFPMHLTEAATIAEFASLFDSIGALPPGAVAANSVPSTLDAAGNDQWKQWRNSKRGKRVLLAIVQDDSTVLYYFMHDGIVKPRQN